MDLKLKNKKAIVFGSTAGIGKAISESLLEENVSVAVNSRRQDRAMQRVNELKLSYPNQTIVGLPADLSVSGQAKKAVEQAIAFLGGLDILVVNTGGPSKGSFEDISEIQWLNDFQNLWLSFVEAVKAALPEFKKNNSGRIILVTSLAAKEPLKNLTTSNGLRAGLSGLCKSLSTEVAPWGITVNVLLPGYTDTDRLRELNLSSDTVKALVPMGRLGSPRELADLATFLCSERAGYITGQCIAIDGGALKSY